MTTQSESKASDGTPLSSIVGRLAHAVARELSPGDVAALRRHRVGRPLSPAFFRVSALVLDPTGSLSSSEPVREVVEERWAVIIAAIAALQGLHSPRKRLGEVLASADFSELRLLRLLRSHDDALADAIATTTHFLASRAADVDLTDLAHLVLSDGRSDEDRVRRRIARSYFNTVTI